MESPRSLIIRFNEMEWHAKGVNKKCSDKKLATKKLKLRVDWVGLLWSLSAKLSKRATQSWWQVFSVDYKRNITNKVILESTLSIHTQRWHFAQSSLAKQQKSRVIKFFSYSSLQFFDNWLESHSSRTVRTVDRKKAENYWRFMRCIRRPTKFQARFFIQIGFWLKYAPHY